MQSVGQERNGERHLLLWLVQYENTGKYPSFSSKDFLVTILNCRFILMSIFNWTHHSIPSQGNNMQAARQCWYLNNKQSQKVLGLLCSELRQIAFSSMAVRIKLYRSRHHRNCIKIGVWCPFTGRPRHFCSEWQLHRCYWHKVHKADWQSKMSTYCASSPQVCRESKWLWKVAGSIPDGVTGIFHGHISSGCTMALGSTQPLTEMSTRNISEGVGKAASA